MMTSTIGQITCVKWKCVNLEYVRSHTVRDGSSSELHEWPHILLITNTCKELIVAQIEVEQVRALHFCLRGFFYKSPHWSFEQLCLRFPHHSVKTQPELIFLILKCFCKVKIASFRLDSLEKAELFQIQTWAFPSPELIYCRAKIRPEPWLAHIWDQKVVGSNPDGCLFISVSQKWVSTSTGTSRRCILQSNSI